MAFQLFRLPKATAISSNLTLLAGAKVEFFLTGTSTNTPVYQDADLNTPHTNPVVADSAGRLPPIYLDPTIVYKATLLNSEGVEIYTVDPVNDQLLSQSIIGGLLYPQTAAEGSAEVTPTNLFVPSHEACGKILVNRYGTNAVPGTTDMTAAVQSAVAVANELSSGLTAVPVWIAFTDPIYFIDGTVLVEDAPNFRQISFCSEGGTRLVGDGSNIGINFDDSGYRNSFRRITFENFGTAIRWSTDNHNESQLLLEDCSSHDNDVCIDTVSYARSRSSMIVIRGMLCTETRRLITHYTDHLTIDNSWMYAKLASPDALLYLSGDGVVTVRESFFIPNAIQYDPAADARFIDFVCDSAQSTPTDRAVKTLNIRGCRASLESARGFIWTYDNNAVKPNGDNAASSITVEDSYVACTGGFPVVFYKQGYPGSVTFRNCKVLASPNIVGVDAGNSTGPVPSTLTAVISHVIMIDEATRLSQSNSYSVAEGALVDPVLEPYVYDTTTQTSKFKRSIRKDIDYRLRAESAGENLVKVTIPIFFDSANEQANRDLLTFVLVTVSDALGPSLSQPFMSATAVSLISIVGGNDGSALKQLVTTVLQDAKGGDSFDTSAAPTVFWGTGDSGSADIGPTSSDGTEDSITAVWTAEDPQTAWAYILPLAGLRENHFDKLQYDVW